MSAFTDAELTYLQNQPIMRFATASLTARPDVAPVVFEIDGDQLTTAGFDITHTVRFRNIQENPRCTVVIDDLASLDPWSPRGIKLIGSAVIEDAGGSPRFRISPEVIISWGINDTTPGIPQMERRPVVA
ncbi:MAG: PPOX class F420-dependent oxidoreductase [Actinobacteria bacterium]|nr:PPOX class F420-dependent oxidoreductase [Actinomycetota bacterium]